MAEFDGFAPLSNTQLTDQMRAGLRRLWVTNVHTQKRMDHLATLLTFQSIKNAAMIGLGISVIVQGGLFLFMLFVTGEGSSDTGVLVGVSVLFGLVTLPFVALTQNGLQDEIHEELRRMCGLHHRRVLESSARTLLIETWDEMQHRAKNKALLSVLLLSLPIVLNLAVVTQLAAPFSWITALNHLAVMPPWLVSLYTAYRAIANRLPTNAQVMRDQAGQLDQIHWVFEWEAGDARRSMEATQADESRCIGRAVKPA